MYADREDALKTNRQEKPFWIRPRVILLSITFAVVFGSYYRGKLRTGEYGIHSPTLCWPPDLFISGSSTGNIRLENKLQQIVLQLSYGCMLSWCSHAGLVRRSIA